MFMRNLLLAAATALLATAAPIKKRVAPNPNLAVDLPLYSWPIDGAWDEVYSALSANPSTQFNIIINPSSGPGDYPPNSDYTGGVSKLNSYGNAHVYGYLRTGFADRAISEIQDDANNYAQWQSHKNEDIHLDGIFVDEAPDSLDKLFYMKDVHDTIHGAFPNGVKIWTNPGATIDAQFYEYADTVTAFETGYNWWIDPTREAIPWDLHSKSSVMIMRYEGTATDGGPEKQAKILMDRGFKSGFLWGQEGYQQFSQVWGKFAGAIKEEKAQY
jgi:hypothetical protein